jgi:type IV secretory pathway VirD2 relaxase
MSRLRIFDRDNDEFKVRLRSIRTTTIVKSIRQGRRIGQHAGRPKAVGLHLPRATHVSSAGVGIVKTKYVSAARTGGLSHYLEKDVPDKMSAYVGRDRAGSEEHKAELFNERGSVSEDERQAFVSRAQRDPRLWHLIVSPPAADQLDMPRFVQSFMQHIEADTGLTLDYIASVHRDTEHVHSHLLVRGRAQYGVAFRFERDYLSHGMRIRAEEVAQRHLALGLNREPAIEQVTQVAHQRMQETISGSDIQVILAGRCHCATR